MLLGVTSNIDIILSVLGDGNKNYKQILEHFL